MARGRPPGAGKYTERQRFIIRVFFLHGMSNAKIARMMQTFGCVMTPGMVQGQVESLGYRKREMPRAVRQRFLDELKKDRIDKRDRQKPLPEWAFEAK